MSSKDINLNSKNKVKHTVKSASQHTVENSWQVLRQYTAARIGLGRAGISVPTKHLLDFQLAHAQAQDAVHLPLDTENLITDIEAHCLSVHSQIQNRSHYLQRPDLGRRLNSESAALLKHAAAPDDAPYDLAIVIVDGLSSLAIQKNAAPLLHLLTQRLSEQSLLNDDGRILSLAPIVIVQQGRVAIGDEVGELLNAKSVLVFIGERPGLSSPDSLGLYLTWAPKLGLTDESRNCISNIRLEGLVYREAVNKVIYLLTQAHQRKLTGVNLKDRSTDVINSLVQDDKNFLLS
ncbi:MAG: ethanolamine ammonia-lyase small subunit [Oleispira sp.]|jgi:ethanolamine ammonia-lyase small subunit